MYPQAGNSATVTASKTLTDADSGLIQNVSTLNANTADVVITLPAAAAGKSVLVVNSGRRAGGPVGSGSSKSQNVIVRPAGTDTMTGNGFTPAAAKGALSSKTSHLSGDFLRLVSGAATWYIAELRGTWAREA